MHGVQDSIIPNITASMVVTEISSAHPNVIRNRQILR
jgi:hypothetical protein